MKPFWRNTLRVLKVIGKIFVWLTGADSPAVSYTHLTLPTNSLV